MNGTRAAESHAAAEFGAGHAERVAKIPEKGHFGDDVRVLRFSVQVESDRCHEETPGFSVTWKAHGALSYRSRILCMPRGNPSPKPAITVDPEIHENILAAAARDR